MIPLTILYDDYIDRQKLSEQKKPIWVYSSSPTKVGRNNEDSLFCVQCFHEILFGWQVTLFLSTEIHFNDTK